MTKEEALKESIKRLSPNHREYTEDIHKKFIDEIYDDFESRTCENCEYLQSDEWCKELNCHIDVDMGLDIKDFGCNMFERKQDDK